MGIKLNIPYYDPKIGFNYNWENGFNIDLKIEDDVVILTANKEGLISLANHHINLSQDTISINYHIHLDNYNALNEGSLELIIQKVNLLLFL